MALFKDPGFQERAANAAKAKQKALDRLRAKPPVDEAILAERNAARLAREAAEAEKRANRKRVVSGKSVSLRVYLGGRRILQKTTETTKTSSASDTNS